MKKIICKIHPFTYKQVIMVYQNGECIFTTSCTLSDFSDDILVLVDRYNINQIDLIGANLITSKIKKDIEKKNMEFYSNKKLNISLY